MSESVAVEIYEYQCKTMHGWRAEESQPWTLKTLEMCNSPEDFKLPGGEWSWASNWRIDKNPASTDEDGWEYASRSSRFKSAERRPKPSAVWGDNARRRMWSRIMRREAGIGKSADLNRVMPKIQVGLKSVHAARLKIEDIMNRAPEAAESDQMKILEKSVYKNIEDIKSALDQVEKQQGGSSSHSGVIKKLRNDVQKEEMAIERALNAHSLSSSAKPLPISKVSGAHAPHGGPISRASMLGTSPRPDIHGGGSSSSSSSSGGGSLSLKDPRLDATRPRTAGGGPGLSAPAVKSGTAGAFNPSVLASASSFRGTLSGLGDEMEDMEGIFVNRTDHERMIEQKLKPVDQATVLQELIDERAVEIDKVHKGILEVNEMFADLSRIVKDQQVEIDTIFGNVEESHAKTKEAFKHIIEANRLQQQSNCAIS